MLRDLPENEFSRFTQHGIDENTAHAGTPEIGVVGSKDIDLEEMQPHYFVPNFVRPMPEAEEDPDLDAPEGIFEHDIAEDVSIFRLSGCVSHTLYTLDNVLDPRNAPRTLLGLQYGDRAIQLCSNEKVPESCMQNGTET